MYAEGFSGLKSFFFQSRRMIVFFVWFLIIMFLILAWIAGESSSDRTVGVSALVCGGSTFLFWNYREKIRKQYRITWSPRKEFVFVGSLGAVWAECVFWFFEKWFGAGGVAASPHLVLDLVITMPWYVIMLFLLYKVETVYHYTFTEILLLGGLYELGADGLFGQVLEGLTVPNLILTVAVFPLFVVVYSVIVLPPTFLLREGIRSTRVNNNGHKYWYGLLPLLGLVPFALYAFVLMGLLSLLA